jgi:hypothetical protein
MAQVGGLGKRFFTQATKPAMVKIAAERSSLLSIVALGMSPWSQEGEGGGSRELLATLSEDGKVSVWSVDTSEGALSIIHGASASHADDGVDCGGVLVVGPCSPQDGNDGKLGSSGSKVKHVGSFGSDGVIKFWRVGGVDGSIEASGEAKVEGGMHAINTAAAAKDGKICFGLGGREEGVDVEEALHIWKL